MHQMVERTLRELEEAVAGKSDADLIAKPAGKWSATDIIEHLAASYHSTAKGLERVLAYGPPVESPSLRQRVSIFVVVTLGHLPEGRSAPEFTIPKGGLSPQQALASLRAGIVAMDMAITRCEEQFGKSARIGKHPILGPMTAQQWRKFHLVHARHHARQIRERSGGAVERVAASIL